MSVFWGHIRRGTIVDLIGNWMLVAAGVTVFIMMIVMAVYVISRKLEMPIPGAFHFSEQTMMILVAFPLAAVALHKGHIQFELFIGKFPPKLRSRLELVNHLVGITVFGAMALYGWQVGFGALAIREYRAGIMEFPVYPFRLALALGLSVFALQLIVLFFRGLADEFRPKPADAISEVADDAVKAE